MADYTEVLQETVENIQHKLNAISSPYDDTIFLDMSLNTREYRIVSKEDKKYLLYIVYRSLGLLGAFSNYKIFFFCKRIENETRIDGKIKLKTFTIIGLVFWFSAWSVILVKELLSKNPSSAISTMLMAVVTIGWLIIEFFYFKKKVAGFFGLLDQALLPPVSDRPFF